MSKVVPLFPAHERAKTEAAPSGELSIEQVLNAAPPAEGYTLLRCKALPGFGAYVTSTGSRAFFVEVRIRGGKPRRRVLGKVGVRSGLKMAAARSMARDLIAEARKGNDISERTENEAQQADAVGALTLTSAWEQYRDARELRPKTRLLYQQAIGRLKEWQQRSLWSITRADVAKRFQEVRKESGDVAASQTFRTLRAIWRHHAATLDQALASPTDVLSLQRAWPKNRRRDRTIDKASFPTWWRSLASIATARDNGPAWTLYFRMLALLGTRRTETLLTEWNDYDERAKLLTYPAERTKSKRALVIPVGPKLAAMLKAHRKAQSPKSPHVFASAAGTLLRHPGNVIARHREKHGTKWSPHDLRRVYTTTADSIGVPSVVKKRLLNHSTTADVTDGYTVPELDDLRKHQARIETAILKRAKA